ncbi:hypothetical protein MIND_01294700 [Mycena indigotica]|uniref:Uncharacterized protein n=1 Tax=Mycena indigotica TaxID=2126181 RepID=A0A8H6S1Y5_9AGAR|nr:uncharacterized protein MIND_01294700 [Mycena indigotica]KAF7290546.1 hypothetical protein MIND_01294700 [Mycena indigotica]
MGRWTVEEWKAHMELDPPTPSGMKMHEIACNVDNWGLHDHDQSRDSKHKPLSCEPRANDDALPPVSCPPTWKSPTPLRESVLHRIFGVMCGRSSPVPITLDTADTYRLPASPLPRSPGNCHRQFTAGHGTPSKSRAKHRTCKLKSKSAKQVAATARVESHYTYGATSGALEILVSTHTTEVQSAHDVGRPRVFYPRSSSLQALAGPGAVASPPSRDKPQSPESQTLVEASTAKRSPRRAIRPLPVLPTL